MNTTETNTELLAQQLHNAPIAQIADTIRKNWRPMSPYAQPYVQAMLQLRSVDSTYGLDSGEEIVLRFLCNAGGWRGPVARIVKAELNRRVRGAGR